MNTDNYMLNAIKADYQKMIEELRIVHEKTKGFHALSLSTLEESKQAYNSETGRAIMRNVYKVFNALESLQKELETIED